MTAAGPHRLDAEESFPGLLYACRFDDAGRGRPIDGDGIEAALADADGWVWLHLNRTNLRCQQWIETRAPIPDSARALLVDEDDHLSLVAEDATLMGVFADFRREFDHTTQDIARLRFALAGRLLITVRRHSLLAVEEMRRAVGAGRDFEAPEDLLGAIFETFAAEVATMVRELAVTLERIEDRIVDDIVADKEIRLGPHRRTVLKLHRQLGALRLHFSAFVAADERGLPDSVHGMVERVALRLDTIGRDIEAMQERARILQEEVSAKLADEANRQLNALSAMTALFLPATLVTGLFGMNMRGLPFEASGSGFWMALATGAAGSAAVYLVLRGFGLMK